MMKRILVILALLLPTTAGAQVAPVRGEAAAGIYENIQSTSQALHVNVTGGTVTSTPGALGVTFTTTTPTVTNSSTTILAAAATRKSVLIQNNHATADVHINFTTTATTAHLKLAAGQSIYLSGILPVAAIQAIGSVASNTSVVVIQGL